MKLFIVAVPLFTAELSVEAYYLHYQNSEKLFGLSDDHMSLDGIMNSPGLDILNEVGIEPFTGGKPICLPVNQYMLLSDFTYGLSIPPELLILMLPSDLPLKEIYLQRCFELKNAGFALAVTSLEVTHLSSIVLKMAKYVVVDTSHADYMDKLKTIRTRFPYIRILFTNVDDMSTFSDLKMIDNALYEGKFYNQPITKGIKKISPLKANALHLLKLVGDEDYSLEDASLIIMQDTSLSISLLKFINSPVIGIKNKVSSIKNAVALLGQKETRKWIMACVSMYIADEKPNEITKLSLTRAKFAENLATAFEMGIHAPALFLMGLFSLLDVILDKPMKEAVKEISVNDKIRNALADGKGEFYEVLSLVYAYERADWKAVSRIMILNNIEVDKLNNAFFDSLVWYRNLLSAL